MNRIFLLLVLFISSTSFSQSLRDSLFSGKLKADSALVAKSKVVKDLKDSARKTEGMVTTPTVIDSAANPTDPAKPVLKYNDNNRTFKKFTDEYIKIINEELSNSK